MPKRYSELPPPRTLRARFNALRNLPPFLKLAWQTSPGLAFSEIVLRLARALLPVITLYVGKLIIDEVVLLTQDRGRPESLQAWFESGLLDKIGWLVLFELLLAILSDVLGRLVSLVNALFSEKFANRTSVKLMEHAATLDLEDFEDSEIQDRLE